MALRRQALDYGDEASQYGFESFKEYKKGTRGGLRGAASGAAKGAQIGAGVGTALGTAVPGVGNLVGLAAGTSLGAAAGAGAGFLSGNRKMKKEYLKYAKAMTEKGIAEEKMNSAEEAAQRADMAAREQARLEDLARQRALYGTTTTQPIVGGELPMFKEGGVAKMVMINVEKGELAIDPRTMKVIMDFNNVPKHPKGKDVINQKGNVKVPVGTIIIPADKRKEFLAAKPAQRIEMAGEIIESQREKEQGEGMEMEEEQMPMQGQGMMAMMGGEEGGEEMEQEKMMNGGYVKKYVDGGVGGVDLKALATPPAFDFSNVDTSTPADLIEAGSGSSISASDLFGGMYGTGNLDKDYPLSFSSGGDKSVIGEQGGQSGLKGGAALAGGLGTALGIVGTAVPQYLLGRRQEREAKKALEELSKKEMARYKPTAELEQQGRDTLAARERAKYGFSPAELAVRQQMGQQVSNTAYQRARESGMGGQLAGALRAASDSQRLRALNELTIADERLREQKAQYSDSLQRSLAQQYQSLANQQTAQDINYRLMQERAYGQAMQQGLENKYGAFSSVGATMQGLGSLTSLLKLLA
jgi:hypothetical protein